jgi:hypothetical protein
MKTYKIEPTYKKSVCEVTLWRKSSDLADPDNYSGPEIKLECWWRWAEWIIQIPETDEEIQRFLQGERFQTLDEYLHYHGAETIEDVILPDEEDDEHLLQSEAECNYCFDGQGEEIKIERRRNSDLNEEELLRMESEVTRVFAEDHIEGLEELGWEEYSTAYEVYCSVTVELLEDEDKKLKRELLAFQARFKADFGRFPERFGGLFDKGGKRMPTLIAEDHGVTFYQDAVTKFGVDQVIKVIDDCVPSDMAVLCEGTCFPLFLVAASCENSFVAVIYHFLRKNPSIVG